MSSRMRQLAIIFLLLVSALVALAWYIGIFESMIRSRYSDCIEAMSSLGNAIELYKVDHDGRVPVVENFTELTVFLNQAGYDCWDGSYGYPDEALGYRILDDGNYMIYCGGEDWHFAEDLSQAMANMRPKDMEDFDCDIVFKDGKFVYGSCQ